MAELSPELVQRLARERETGSPVLSLFLNVDGKANIRPDDYRLRLDAMVKEASKQHDNPIVVSDIDRIARYVNDEFERGKDRGLAIFVSGNSLWEIVDLPRPVEDRIIVNSSPYIRPLETALSEYEKTGVLLTDKQRARLLVVELGRVVEREELVNPLPRHDDDKGDWDKDHVKAHASVSAQHHLRQAAQQMFELYQRHPFDYMVLGIAEEAKTVLERELHAYLRTRVIGHIHLPVASADDEVVDAVQNLVAMADRRREAEYVERLRAGVNNGQNHLSERSNGTAVAGLEPTLQAVFEKRVDTLLVSEGFSKEGWRCHGCSYIAAMGRKCPMCGGDMALVPDVVEEAVEDALGQKCRVEFCSENADLDVLGRIGALLRF